MNETIKIGIGVVVGIFLGFLIFSNDSKDTMMMDHSSGEVMDEMMDHMSSRMQGLSGDALDKVFLEDMIVHHEGAVQMAEILKEGTKRPELQKMADDIVTVQTQEINMMKGWLEEWF